MTDIQDRAAAWWRDPAALIAEDSLCKWARHYARRDEVVRDAVAAGVSVHRVAEVTGLARTTVVRILAAPKAPRRIPMSHLARGRLK